jgi:acetylornithine deacetylase/succinyl-diaminopimelate desuccinylase-like protein
MDKIELAISFASDHRQEFLDDLRDFLRIQSISALSAHQNDVKQAAEWVAAQLVDTGIEDVRVLPTGGHPSVFGSWLQAGDELPTILVYGHYDVQPVDPINEWKSSPFDPEIRGENIYARGATDMKAQLVAFLEAVKAYSRTSKSPVNLKFLIEGEEEIGSKHLEQFILQNQELLQSDFCLNLDAGILAPEVPSIMYGLRGLAYFEIRLQGPASDLHSGKFGGAIENPALVLCELIAGMRDARGRITLPGFYDKVRPLSAQDRAEMAQLPQDDQWWLEQTGAQALRQDTGFSATERATARPTLDINGLQSGFTGEGSKTVLPATAMAKISMRLVPDQTPEDVRRSLDAYLAEHLPDTVTCELIEMHGARPSISSRDFPAVRAASKALEKVWGRTPLFTRDGGSVPVVGLIQQRLGIDSLLLGFGLPNDNPHAPNEKQHLPTFFRGIETYIYFLAEIAAEKL